MPLSEQEQRLLDEMERSLYQNDADFVATVGSQGVRASYTTMVIGTLLTLAGIGVLVAGVALQMPLVGVLGFILMFGGVLLFVAPPRRGRRPIIGGANRQGATPTHHSFMDSLNQRWDGRTDRE